MLLALTLLNASATILDVSPYQATNEKNLAGAGAACSARPTTPTLGSISRGMTVPLVNVPLDWSEPSCATRYDVTIKLGSPLGVTVDAKAVTISRYVTRALTKGKTYYWRARACNAAGCSAWSVWWTFKVAP